MKILSWNVNGFRAVLKKGFLGWFEKEHPDILCLQETKLQKGQHDFSAKGYTQYWNYAEKRGYSGTAIFSRVPVLGATYGIGKEEHDKEGRVITIELKDFFLVNAYTPNSKRGLERLDYRQGWDKDLLRYLKALEKRKPIIICGDLNVAHKERDLKNPKNNIKNAGFTQEERKGMDNLIKAGFVDTFREFNKEPGNYTWWSYMFNARAKDIGWRIDYFLISKCLKERLKEASILKEVMGSDHCPIKIVID